MAIYHKHIKTSSIELCNGSIKIEKIILIMANRCTDQEITMNNLNKKNNQLPTNSLHPTLGGTILPNQCVCVYIYI